MSDLITDNMIPRLRKLEDEISKLGVVLERQYNVNVSLLDQIHKLENMLDNQNNVNVKLWEYILEITKTYEAAKCGERLAEALCKTIYLYNKHTKNDQEK